MGDFVDLTEMTAVVIGGKSGVGPAISQALARAGSNVVVSGQGSAQVEAAGAALQALRSKSLAQPCDSQTRTASSTF